MSLKTSTLPVYSVQRLHFDAVLYNAVPFLWKCVLIAYDFLQSVCMNLIRSTIAIMPQTACKRSTVVLDPQSSRVQLCSSSRPGNQQLFSSWLPGLCVSGAGTWSGTELLLVMHWISPAVLYLCLSSSCRINFPPSFPPRDALHALPLVVFGGKWVIWQKKNGGGRGGRIQHFTFSTQKFEQSFSSVFEWLLERDTLMGHCVAQSQPVKRFS